MSTTATAPAVLTLLEATELAARCLLSTVGVTPLESVWACTVEWARHRTTLTAFHLAARYLLDVEDRLHEMREEAKDAAAHAR